MAEITDWEKARFEHQIKVKPVRIYLESDDPNGSKGINQRKMAKARQKSYPIIKKYIDAMDNNYQWKIKGIQSSWAKSFSPIYHVSQR